MQEFTGGCTNYLCLKIVVTVVGGSPEEAPQKQSPEQQLAARGRSKRGGLCCGARSARKGEKPLATAGAEHKGCG